MIYFTADTHFGHANIIKYCNRPFSCLGEMDEAMVHAWNQTVHPNDTIFHLGDVMLMRDLVEANTFLSRLNGKKFLCVGNHDGRMERKVLRNHFEIIDKNKVSQMRYVGLDNKAWLFLMRHIPFFDKGSDFQVVRLCGHVHTDFEHRDGTINVGVDVRGFRPISAEEVIEIQKKIFDV